MHKLLLLSCSIVSCRSLFIYLSMPLGGQFYPKHLAVQRMLEAWVAPVGLKPLTPAV